MARPFLLLAYQRSGTNLLREALNTHPVVHQLAEVLSVTDHPASWHRFAARRFAQEPPMTFEALASALDEWWTELAAYARGEHQGDGRLEAVGVDIKLNQLAYIAPVHHPLAAPSGGRLPRWMAAPGRIGRALPWRRRRPIRLADPFLIEYCRSRSVPVIHLRRDNPVHVALSVLIGAARGGVWHAYGDVPELRQYRIEPGQVLAYARDAVRQDRALEQSLAGIRHVTCSYETLVGDLARAGADGTVPPGSTTFTAIAQLLGVDDRFRRPKHLRKVVHRPYAEVIANHDEVCAAVRASEFARLTATL